MLNNANISWNSSQNFRQHKTYLDCTEDHSNPVTYRSLCYTTKIKSLIVAQSTQDIWPLQNFK